MPPIVITEKYVAGYIVNADGDPEVNSTLTATLSDRIVNQVTDYIMEIDEAVQSTATDPDGRFEFQLHPNNSPNDQPANTHWTITEPSGHQETIFIPYDHPQGGTSGTAIKYTSLIIAPEDLEPPENIAALEGRLDYLEATVAAMNTLDDAALDALDPAVPTDLVDAAQATGTLADASTDGILAKADFQLLQTFKASGTNDAAYLARLVSPDSGTNKYLRLPVAADPSATSGVVWLYQSATDLTAKVQLGPLANRVQISPGLVSPAWKVSTDISVPAATYQDLYEFPVVAGATYDIDGQFFYNAGVAVDMAVRFTGIPTGATLRWSRNGITVGNTNADGTGSGDFNLATGNEALIFGGAGSTVSMGTTIQGTLTMGITAGTVTLQAKQNTANATAAKVLSQTYVKLVRDN